MVGCTEVRHTRFRVKNTSRLKLMMMLMILISLTAPSFGDSCENTIKKFPNRKPEEYEDGTIPFVFAPGLQQVDLPICRFKNTYNCLGLTGNEVISAAEKLLLFSIVQDGIPDDSPALRNAKATTLETNRAFAEFSGWFCVSGKCQLDTNVLEASGKCVPDPSGKPGPNKEVFKFAEFLAKINDDEEEEKEKEKKESIASSSSGKKQETKTKSSGVTGQPALHITVVATIGLSLSLFNHFH